MMNFCNKSVNDNYCANQKTLISHVTKLRVSHSCIMSVAHVNTRSKKITLHLNSGHEFFICNDLNQNGEKSLHVNLAYEMDELKNVVIFLKGKMSKYDFPRVKSSKGKKKNIARNMSNKILIVQ